MCCQKTQVLVKILESLPVTGLILRAMSVVAKNVKFCTIYVYNRDVIYSSVWLYRKDNQLGRMNEEPAKV